MNRLWLDQGGVFAETNLRGGGEYGEEWHKGGNLLNKQNVFDDMVSCAKQLVVDKYTSIDKLAIIGGSNGGLLMGAELTQSRSSFGRSCPSSASTTCCTSRTRRTARST